jgi:hypothetical protein
MPAANMVGEVFLDRTPMQLANPEELLAGIVRETSEIKRLGLGQAMIRTLRIVGAFPRGMQCLLPDSRCLATVFFSNFGVAFAESPLCQEDGLIAADDVVLDHLMVRSATRPLTPAVFTAWTYAGRLTISLSYDTAALSGDQSEQLLQNLMQRLTATVERDGCHVPTPLSRSGAAKG